MATALDKLDQNLNAIDKIWKKHGVKIIWIVVILIGGIAYFKALA